MRDAEKPVLTVDRVSVATTSASPKTLVDEISFTIRAGETLCVVGESGSGKSVTSLAIMGLLSHSGLTTTGGEIWLEQDAVLKASQAQLRAMRARRMAMIFQEPMTALNPVETIGTQIEEVLRIHTHDNSAKRRQRVLEMLKSVHMPEPERIINAYPHQISGGQRQRVVICMALILKPKLLIADEPTTALDVTTQKQILTLISELQREHNTAVLFITHDFGVVAEIADNIVVMNQGKMVEIGSREQILSGPTQPYTRMLVSSVPSLVPPAARSYADDVPVLDVKGLSKVYREKKLFGRRRDVHAANNISLSIRSREVLGIVGESGSGKSTVARCISRLLTPDQGQVLIDGVNVADMKGDELRRFRRKLQVVFQDPYRSLNPRMLIRDSIAEGLSNFGTPKDEGLARACELLDMVGMDVNALDRYPHQFSGGQRQRICIARALALEPRLLIADEAVSALDVSVQAQILELLADIRDRTGVAVLFITHDLRVAAQICDDIIVMQNGNIVEQGPVAQILTQPEQAYTRALIDSAPGKYWDFKNFRPVRTDTFSQSQEFVYV